MNARGHKAEIIRQAHQEGNLILNNAWSAMTTKIAERVGDKFIATSSGGIAWDNGYASAQDVSFRVMLSTLRSIVHQTKLPVSADINEVFQGQSLSTSEIIKAVREVGVAAVTVRDSDDGQQLDIETGAQRIKDIREAGEEQDFPLFITAEIDSLHIGNEEATATIIERSKAYIEAGAECIYIPYLKDLELCKDLVQAIPAPIGTMYTPDGPSAHELFTAGLKRVNSDYLHPENAYAYLMEQMKNFSSTGTLTSASELEASIGVNKED